MNIVCIYISTIIYITDNIGLTFNIITISLYVSQFRNRCGIFKFPSEHLTWAILIPDIEYIYIGVSGSCTRDFGASDFLIWSINGMSKLYSAQYHPVTIVSCPYRNWYHNTHHGSYSLNLQHYHSSTSYIPIRNQCIIFLLRLERLA